MCIVQIFGPSAQQIERIERGPSKVSDAIVHGNRRPLARIAIGILL